MIKNICFIVMVALTSNAYAKLQKIVPDQVSILGIEDCRSPKELEKKWFPENWKVYAHYIKVCPLGSNGQNILNILSVDFQSYFNENKQKSDQGFSSLSKSLIIGPKGEKLGELPTNLIADGPNWLQLVFWSWENNFPQRIVPLMHSSSVYPSEALTEIYWDKSEKLFKSSVNPK